MLVMLLRYFVVNLSFENRIKELNALKDSQVRLNPKVIETWINETLLDAEHLDIPGVVLKPEHKNPISRYLIDRLTLTVSNNINVNRIMVCRMSLWIGSTEACLCTV